MHSPSPTPVPRRSRPSSGSSPALACSAEGWRIDRRDFLKASAATLFGLTLARTAHAAATSSTGPAALRSALRFGLVTDPHYADADTKGTRFYRESLGKVRTAVTRLREERVAFLGVLGDLKDMATGEDETRTLSHLVAIEQEIQRFGGPTYHVLGNHDMDNLSKARVVANLTNTGIAAGRSYYAFSRDGVRFIVLDATYDKDYRDYDHGKFDWKDANVPPAELAWLSEELTAATEPVIVLAHQRLDGEGPASVRNREDVRRRLEASGKVLAVFQGHDHPGAYTAINGIHYYTLRAVIEGSGEANNAFAVVEVHPDLNITITGFHRAVGMKMPRDTAVSR
jgi:hypothetical protein